MSQLPIVEKDVREKVQNAITRHNLKQVDIAKETGINHSSLSLWLQGKIKGHEKLTDRIENTMIEWLKTFTQNMPHFREQMEEEERKKFNQYGDSTDLLIPVSIDSEIDGQRFKEFFSWNASEPQLTPEQFSKIISDENSFPPQIEMEIVQAINKAVASYKPFEYTDPKEEYLRVIEIGIRIENVQFKDQFEWDINDENNSPEAFAWALAEEMGLNGEFAQRIAHQVREQVQFYQKQLQDKKSQGLQQDESRAYKKQTRSIIDVNPAFIQFDNQKSMFQPEVITKNNYMRPFSTPQDPDFLLQWEPSIEILDQNEIRKMQKQEERKIRYNKRTGGR